jgi:hypothetical protein
MHEILVIFKKDVRRLWWQIGAMLAMSAVVGCLDAGRAAAQPGVAEGLLNMVLPLVWACLVAQAIHGEPLVGDREFWMTRPYRWGRLLAAKALFAALFVHVPSLVTDAAILAAHGYNPLHALPPLLVKQLLLAGGLTLPAMALAAVVSNLTQFVVGVPVLFATLAVGTAFRRSYPPIYVFQQPTVAVLGVAVLAVAAVAIVWLQYRRRRTRLSRILAVAAAAGVALTIVLFSQPVTFPMSMARVPAASTHLTMMLLPPDPRTVHGPYSRRVYIELPYTVSGISESDRGWLTAVSMEIVGANGVRYVYDPPRDDFEVGLMMTVNRFTRLSVAMPSAAYERIKDGRVTISGKAGFVLYRLGRKLRLPAGATRDVTGRMRCSCAYDEGRYDYGYLDVFCDSPYREGLLADIRVEEKSKNWLWPGYRASGTNGSPTPLLAWLSPLERRQQSYRVTVPRDWTLSEILEELLVTIVPQYVVGRAIANFKAVDIDLREYSK